MATQNPVEQEGTDPIPEAQLDRFLFKLHLDYPSYEEEIQMVGRWGQVTSQPSVTAVSSGEELLALRKSIDYVHVAVQLHAYIVELVRATRGIAAAPENIPSKPRTLFFGASPLERVNDNETLLFMRLVS
jgi:MoxR-like ATPase